MDLAYPFRVDRAGRTAEAAREAHIRQMIEQVLFTVPGERVNLPEFGTGLRNYLFAAESDETLTAVQFLVEGALTQWLGDLIEVQGVEVSPIDSTMAVQIRYCVRDTRRAAVADFYL